MRTNRVPRDRYFPSLAVLVCATLCASAMNLAEPASIIRLVATPERFKGRFVQITGVLRYGWEFGAVIYHSREAASVVAPKDGIGLITDYKNPETRNKLMALNGRYVYVSGIFEPDDDPKSLWTSGKLKDIVRLERNLSADQSVNQIPKSDGR